MPFLPNPGHCPDEALVFDADGNVTGSRRVHVRLRCGIESRAKSPDGWIAHGRGECRWTLDGSDFDIVEFEVI